MSEKRVSTEARPVVAARVHGDEPARTELTIDIDGTAGSATATLEATDWHPIWVVDLNAWIPIVNITAGSWLQTSAGTWVQVTAVRHYTNHTPAHDLTVDDIHTYHVLAGATSVLVHNCGSDGPAFGEACTCSDDQVFVRRGTSWESTGRLEKQAEAAENNSKPFGHGVSVTTPESNARLSRDPTDVGTATKAEIEAAGVTLRYTPTNNDRMHHTLELPKPLDSTAASIFNTLFGRKR
ncbi:polymorphic toxin-type HINT domain-containing protein [Kibdelosporangium persicum]|uniref:polymorphic toxin-type HINT domain-containing protein n=1 Tax=Kibdelosporangium persicum TaxID=2698649 RepID=UPI0015640BAA|nr:polymorphic toxin-type HINT domain-containing protein [Kibdelosporangium persicum]